MHVRGVVLDVSGWAPSACTLAPVNILGFSPDPVGRRTTRGAPAPFSHPTETFLTARSRRLVPHKHVTQDE